MKIQNIYLPVMLKFVFSLLLITLMLGACQEEEPFAFSEDDLKMVDVLIDVYTVDAAIRDYSDLSEKDSLKRAYFDEIYQIHGVDKEWLDSERARLESDPVRMDSVYSKALAAIELLKGQRPK